MKKILVLSFFPAFTPPSNGGQSRLYNFYKSLSRWHKVTLLTSSHLGVDEERVDHGVNFVERRIPKDHFFSEQWQFLSSFSSGGDLSGPSIAAASKFATLFHMAYLDEYDDADVIIHDSPFTVSYDIFRDVDSKIRVYNAYNSETLLYQTLHPSKKSNYIHDLVRASERSLLESADLVLYCNEGDLLAFRELAPESNFRSHYAPNGMFLHTMGKCSDSTKPDKPNVIFMGSGHPPNIAAANFIIEKLAPQLLDVNFQIIGSCLPKGRYPVNVMQLGVVSDAKKNKLLHEASLALNPMVDGSGSNVKVLDYFSYCLPVLSTLFGMRGINAVPGQDFIEAALDEFIAVLRSSLSNRDGLHSIGEAGQRLAAEHYTWDAIAKNAADKITELCMAKSQAQPRKYVFALNDYDSFTGVGGGGTRTRGIYAAVAQWCPVVFLCFSNMGELTTRWYTNNVLVITVPKSRRHEESMHRVNASFHISCDDIVASQNCLDEPLFVAIYSALRKNSQAIVIEHCYLVPLPLAYGDRFVYSSQNIEVELKSRLLQYHPHGEELVDHVQRVERKAVECAAAIIAVSDDDARGLLKGVRTAGPVIVIRNGADQPPAAEHLAPELTKLGNKISQRSVVFLGSAHMPNVESAKIIVELIAPACPEIEFHLIGSVCSALHMNMPKNVRLWGILDENSKCVVMQSCTIAINPMVSGGGSNIKLADYMGNGLFVVTTEFGQRGYPASILGHVKVAEIGDFPRAIKDALSFSEELSLEAREARHLIFREQLTMKSLGGGVVKILKDLAAPKKKILFVTYRYTSPAMGGAESMIEHLITGLATDGSFSIDIVAPEVSHIDNQWRFNESYRFEAGTDALTNLANVRFARFPVTKQDEVQVAERLQAIWRAQTLFEKVVSQQIEMAYDESGITWGWGYPEPTDESVNRWAMVSCGLHAASKGHVSVKGFAPNTAFITVRDNKGLVLCSATVNGEFTLEFEVESSVDIELETSINQMRGVDDPRPLAFIVSELKVSDVVIDLSAPTIRERTLHAQAADRIFEILNCAAEKSRYPLDINLTDSRGPWSDGLERYIAENVAKYDLVVTHNNIFRPAVVAIAEAKCNSVPVILIPHTHLDDDFYHFPDLLESAKNADLVLAAPKAACEFLRRRGCNTQYLPAGVDTAEVFSSHDVDAFRRIWPLEKPFVLVLGRKAGAKGYRKVISAVESLNRLHGELHVVLIGPDDDGVPVESPAATYLGRQPREVVRGALQACLAVVNMSSSESFGIVLLEAWLAGRPVIANKACAAFHDLATDEESALLVDQTHLADAIIRIRDDAVLTERLIKNGHQIALRYDWLAIERNFLDICTGIMR